MQDRTVKKLANWITICAGLGVVASALGVVVSVMSAYLWAGGNLDIFVVLVSNMNVLATGSSVAIIAFILFANVWFYWILLGEPIGAVGKTLHTASTVAVLVSLNLMPSYLTIAYGAFLIALIVLRVRKIEKSSVRAFIAKFLPTQTILFAGILGSLVAFLTFGIGMISNVSAEINHTKQISGTGLVTGNELIIVNPQKTIVSFYPRSEVSSLQIQTQIPNWALTPIASLWVESVIKK